MDLDFAVEGREEGEENKGEGGGWRRRNGVDGVDEEWREKGREKGREKEGGEGRGRGRG